MTKPSRWLALVGAAGGLLVVALVLDYHWPKTNTFYFEDCRQRDELRRRLAASSVKFSVDERGGTNIGQQDPDEVARKLNLPSLHQVPPAADSTCTR
jgi:hypothetical protein